MNNATTQGTTKYTHESFKAGMAELKKRAKCGDETPCTWDAGDGMVARSSYCSWRKRIVHTTVMPSGVVIV